MKALLFAAGKGTRLRPLTDTMPKALVPVAGKPLLAHTLERLRSAGVDEVVVNVHHFGEQIIDYIAAHPVEDMRIAVSDERDCLLDTGGGLRKALPLFSGSDGDPVLLHNVDILSNAALADFYRANRTEEVALLVSRRPTTRYLLFDDDMRLKAWTNITTREVRTPFERLDVAALHPFAFSGIHLFSPRLRARMAGFPDKFPIMDFYLTACRDIRIKGYVQPGLRLLDVGKQDTLSAAETFLETLS